MPDAMRYRSRYGCSWRRDLLNNYLPIIDSCAIDPNIPEITLLLRSVKMHAPWNSQGLGRSRTMPSFAFHKTFYLAKMSLQEFCLRLPSAPSNVKCIAQSRPSINGIKHAGIVGILWRPNNVPSHDHGLHKRDGALKAKQYQRIV